MYSSSLYNKRTIPMSENIGYIRVSSEGQNIDRQLDTIILDKRFIDKISGASKDRPQLNACLTYIRSGDTLHIHSIDRLARSLRDLQEIVDALVSRGITVIFHTERLTFTSEENPVSTMMLQMLGMIAQFERTLTKKRQREGIDIAKQNGKHLGRPTIDYTRRDEAIDLSKQGNNITQIAKAMNLSRASIYKLLS
jgi:DNA invertase Pin-like site-specific DNA recombinase